MTHAIDSIFISHGAPTYALEPGLPGKALEAVGRQLIAQQTSALIVLSPHWRSAKLAVTSHAAPVIVHDFHGFPRELYELKPEICGVPELAHEPCERLDSATATHRTSTPTGIRPWRMGAVYSFVSERRPTHDSVEHAGGLERGICLAGGRTGGQVCATTQSRGGGQRELDAQL
jgi:hypothetical protein